MTQPLGEQSRNEFRLIDQAASMHATLRDRAVGRTTTITVGLLSSAAFSIAFAFAGDLKHVTILGVTAARSTWLGVLAVVTFVATLVDLVTDRRGAARRHDSAVRLLADLKVDYRKADPTEPAATRQARLTDRYQAVMEQLPPIPESLFNKLKAAHLRKVEISKLLSEKPGISARAAGKELDRRLRA